MMMEQVEGDCPLCRCRYDDPTDLRVHLMTDHRKSELTVELLRLLAPRRAVGH